MGKTKLSSRFLIKQFNLLSCGWSLDNSYLFDSYGSCPKVVNRKCKAHPQERLDDGLLENGDVVLQIGVRLQKEFDLSVGMDHGGVILASKSLS